MDSEAEVVSHGRWSVIVWSDAEAEARESLGLVDVGGDIRLRAPIVSDRTEPNCIPDVPAQKDEAADVLLPLLLIHQHDGLTDG